MSVSTARRRRTTPSAGAGAPAEPPKDCDLCPRLVEFRAANREAAPQWFNGAVPSFGDEHARLLIVGLAPGLQGANKTGRPFTGDFAGDLLYATLLKFGFAEGRYEARPDDGLTLTGAMITNAVRCVPPQNKPTGPEAKQCRPFLAARIAALPRLTTLIALGRVAHENVLAALGARKSDHPFAHGARHALVGPEEVGPEGASLTLFDSYHCSRYNTNTGRLTPAMFEAVFDAVRRELD